MGWAGQGKGEEEGACGEEEEVGRAVVEDFGVMDFGLCGGDGMRICLVVVAAVL